MAPALDLLAEQLQGTVKIVKLDIVSSPFVSAELGVRGLPTLFLFKDGKPAGRHLGAIVQEEKLKEKIDAMVADGSEKPLVAPRATMFKLENGMDVVVIPDQRTSTVNHMLLYKAGAVDAPLGASGVAKFVQHLMTKSFAESGILEIARMGREVTSFQQGDFDGPAKAADGERSPAHDWVAFHGRGNSEGAAGYRGSPARIRCCTDRSSP
jgi:hypothetical protein